MSIASDDFDSVALSGIWLVQGPAGTSSGLATQGDESYLTLSTEAGDHNVWTENKSAHALQTIGDDDFEVEVKFLSTPTEQYQMQGILVMEDADSWIRFDTYSDGTSLHVFASVTLDGVPTTKINVTISASAVPYLKVLRVGDVWTLSYSVDGTNWTTAGSFTQALNVTSVGPFAGSTGGAQGYTAEVDYFFDATNPPATEDGQTSNAAPIAADDSLTVVAGNPLIITVATDILANDSDPDGDAISLMSFTQPANGTLTDNGDGTLTYTPNAGHTGPDTFQYVATDGSDTASATVTIDVTVQPSAPVSDDFNDATLASRWLVGGPAGTSSGLATQGDESYLTLSTEAGDHDVWTENKSAHALQTIGDDDFEVEVKFLSTPTEQYQMQGILVMEDADSWIRFDTYSDGTSLHVFASVTLDGEPTTKINITISASAVPYLKVLRVGDVWTLSYSVDGTNWTTAGSFTQALNVTSVGPFAGSTGAAQGYTAEVDYFFDATNPPATEDGQTSNAAPIAADDSLTVVAGNPLIITVATDILANDSDPDGDAISLMSFTQPANGTLTDNGDGTLTYTPNAGHTGPDTFQYVATDGSDTASATVTIDVTVQPSAPVSDDFNDATLASRWLVGGPAGTSSGLATQGDESYLTLSTEAGDHDVWTENKSAHALQTIGDDDFEVEVKFLSTPTEQYQMQGILVVEDADSWIRFDTYSDGTSLHVFASVTLDGEPTTKINITISASAVPYLKVLRVGDVWTLSYSVDGTNWTTAGSFTQALNVTSVGPFAGSTGAAQGYTAEVDYFFDATNPPATEDGQTSNAAPIAADDSLTVVAGNPLIITVATDILANDSDPDGDAISLMSFTQPAGGTLTDNGDGTLTYTPNAGHTGPDTFQYVATDGSDTASATVTIDVTVQPSAPVSDDFNDATLASRWLVGGPAGTSSGLATQGDESYLTLSTEAGDHDVWTENKSAHALQTIGDDDFEVEVKFLSTPTEQYQMQGILVVEDADSWIRFDTYSDGTSLHVFASVTLDGEPTTKINVTISASAVPYLKVSRVGDVWTLSYSVDGTNWTTAGSFTQALNVTSVGPFAGSTGAAQGYTAEVDYFFDATNPPVTEDGQTSNAAPIAADDSLTVVAGNPLIITVATDILANDSDPDGDAISLMSFTQPAGGTLTDNGDGTLTYTPNAGHTGPDTFQYVATDGSDTASATVTIDVTVQPSAPVSDDFNDATLASRWLVGGPAGTSSGLATQGDESYLTLSTEAGDHDVWTENKSAHALQTIGDDDFEVEVKFLSTPTEQYQMQGILVVEDADSWIRFDTYSDGTSLHVFASVTLDGEPTTKINVTISASAVPYLKVSRVGDVWTLSYSVDGTNWTTAGSFTQALNVTSVGPFAGSTGAAQGYTAEVDYFFDATNPPVTEDGQTSNAAPIAADDSLTVVAGNPLIITVATDILANDSDPDGDAISLMSFTQPANGTLTDNGDGTLTYTPNAGFSGVDRFDYTVTDGGFTSTATARIEVDNQAPSAVEDSAVLDEDTTIIVDVLANDTDPNGDALTITSVGGAANGTVAITADGKVQYTPNANYFGTDVIRYEISDGVRLSSGVLNLTVNAVEDPPQANDDNKATAPNTVLALSIAADLLANDFDADGDTLSFVSFGQGANGQVAVGDSGTITYTPNPGFEGQDSFAYTISDGTQTSTANVIVKVGSPINVWYGTTQTFGLPGEAQTWINILGNVQKANLAKLTYSLNGGPDVQLTVGPFRRLENEGDFNIDIAYADLDGSAADDIVTIKATLNSGQVITQDVVIDYESGNDWSSNYSIDWSKVTNIQDVVQVVDGLWSISAAGARPVETGYDRLLAIGDKTWDNYLASFTLTFHDVTSVDPSGENGGGFGFGMLWNGHGDDFMPGNQPKLGFNDAAYFFRGPFAWNTSMDLHQYGDWFSTIASGPGFFEVDKTYEFRIAVEQVGAYNRQFSYKAWEVGANEPTNWQIQATQTFDTPVTGAFAFIPHYWDFTLGNVQVSEIVGSDIIQGEETSDVISAVDTSQPNPGAGEIDVLIGGAGNDQFIIGSNGAVFYDDGNAQTGGTADYALIWDFDRTQDSVRLAGSAADYSFTTSPAGLEAGLALYRIESGGQNELIAVFRNESDLDLTNPEFIFDLIA